MGMGQNWVQQTSWLISWLVVSTPLKNMNVNWDNYSQYMEKYKSYSSHHQPDHQQSLVISDYYPQTDDPLMIIPKPLTEPLTEQQTSWVIVNS